MSQEHQERIVQQIMYLIIGHVYNDSVPCASQVFPEVDVHKALQLMKNLGNHPKLERSLKYLEK
jgi:hypothetical protein